MSLTAETTVPSAAMIADGLEVVGGDLLALHPEHCFRDLGEAASLERACDVERR